MRIVSLVPSITLALHQLGLGGQIVGRTDYCIHPQEAVAAIGSIGGTKNPDLQKIRGLRPDLVVANTDEQRRETLEELEEGPWDLLVTETDSMMDVAETWSVLGAATGTREQAQKERVALETLIERTRQESAGRPPIRVLVPVWKDPWMAAGGGTYLGDLLSVCGMQNVLAKQTEKWVLFADTLDKQQAQTQRPTKGPMKERAFAVLESPPQAVLLPTEPYAFQEAHRGLFESLGVPRQRVVVVDGELLTWWLSQTKEALVTFSRLAQKLAQG